MDLLGEVRVRIKGDLAPFEADLARARAETTAFDQAAQRAFSGTERGMAQLNAIARQTEAVMERINRVTGVSGASRFRREASDITAYGQELDRLRAKYNPIFAASKMYEAELDELNRAHAVGAINAMEHGAALDMLNARYQQNATAANRFGVDARGATANVGNLAFQIQDIGMMMAMGQSPFMLLAQQLPQITMYGGSLNGVMAALRQTVTGLVSPLGLLTTGFVLAGSAAISWLTSAEDGADAVAEALEAHHEALGEIIEGYRRAEEAADNYRKRATTLPIGEVQDDLQRQREKLVDDQAAAIERLRDSMEHLNEYVLVYARGTEFEDKAREQAAALTEIQEAAQAAEPDLDGIIRALKNFVANDPYHVLKPIAEEMLSAAEAARQFGAEIETLDAGAAQVNDVEAAFNALQAAIDGVSSDRARQELEDLLERAREGEIGIDDVRDALVALSGTTPDLSSAIGALVALFDQAIATRDALANMMPGTGGPRRYSRGVNTRPDAFEVPLPDQVDVTPEARVDPYFVDWRSSKGGGGGRKSAAQRSADRYDKMLRDAEKFIELQQLEVEALGMTEEAAAALRYEQDLLNKAIDAGVKVTPEIEAEIRSYAEAMAEAEAEAKRATESLQAWNSAGQAGGGLIRQMIDDTMTWKEALLEVGKIVLKLLNDLNVAGGGKGIFGGGLLQGLIGGILGIGFADGGVFDRGQVTAFARGGVVNRPTLFPMANGAGLMGEAGPEAIMPLRRLPSGRLGVESMSGAGLQRVIQEVRLLVIGEEGPMFRPAIRAESQDVAVQVSDQRVGRYNQQQQRGGVASNFQSYDMLKRRK